MRYLIRRFCGRTFAVDQLAMHRREIISVRLQSFSHAVSGLCLGEVILRYRWKREKKSRRVWPYPYTAKLARYKLNSGAARLKWKVEISLLMWCMYHQHNLTFSDG